MIFIILGPSGCGKGTQAELLARQYDLVHISTGDLLRRAYEEGTPLGRKAHKWWGRGNWVPTAIVGSLLATELRKHPTGNFILEGWPRLSEQKELLGRYLSESGLKIDKVFYLDTPREVSVERIKNRIREAEESGGPKRPDDTAAVINERLDSYYRTVEPILEFYRGAGLLEVIDNRPSVDEVFSQIVSRVNDYLKNSRGS